jgi:cytochrome c oxidase cbb3-type subunit 3
VSAFWSGWIIGLIVLNLGISLLLFLWAQRVTIPTAPDGTSGHTWAHGVLREGVRRLPRWWIALSATMFLCAFAYLALYPGFGSFAGVLGWTSQREWQRETATNAAKLEPVMRRLQDVRIDTLRTRDVTAEIGRRLYLDNCAACHGRDALGNRRLGAPNLTDQDWLYGGDPNTVVASILDGRHGVMPPWGAVLGADGVVDVASYVLSLSGTAAPRGWIEAGKARFATTCAACHGIDARGTPQLGAPNLRDDTWLYGGDFASVAQSIRDGRSGVMPAWRTRLDADEVRAIAAWIYATGARAGRQPPQ